MSSQFVRISHAQKLSPRRQREVRMFRGKQDLGRWRRVSYRKVDLGMRRTGRKTRQRRTEYVSGDDYAFINFTSPGSPKPWTLSLSGRKVQYHKTKHGAESALRRM